MKVVFDTNVIISATLWQNSSARKILRTLITKDIEIVTSNEIIEEFYEAVTRDFNYPEEKTREALNVFLSIAKVIETSSRIDIIKSDPDDNKILECAVDSSSDYILTYDKHLLVLKEFRGIRIVKPEDFFC